MNARIKKKLEQAVINAYFRVYNAAPKDTKNLAVNALKMEETPDGYVIYIDEDIAPYMPYTNEPWISPRWGGKQNPNEFWFDNVAEEIVKSIATMLQGKMEKTTIVDKFAFKEGYHT